MENGWQNMVQMLIPTKILIIFSNTRGYITWLVVVNKNFVDDTPLSWITPIKMVLFNLNENEKNKT